MSEPKQFPTKVRTTQRPDVEIEVDQQEWTDLSRQGLLVDTPSKSKDKE